MSTVAPEALSSARYASGGPRSPRGTLTQLFFEAVERGDAPDAVQAKVDGAWMPVGHRTILERVRRIALGLRSLGVAAQDRVALLSENRPEWLLVDYACLCASLVDVPIYPTLPADQLPFLLNDSGARVVVVSTPDQARKVAAIRGQVPGVRAVVGMAAAPEDGCDLTLAELESRGAAADSPAAAAQFREEALAVSPDQLVTLIYTSGTTGTPKGVMLSHDNLASNVGAVQARLPVGPSDLLLSFLPLSHIFARTGDYYAFAAGARIAYAESIDTVPANVAEVRPTVMLSVPRLYEKIYARMVEGALAGGALRARLFFWARRVGGRWSDAVLAGEAPGAWLAAQHRVASALVYQTLRQRLGGRLRFLVSGGAPLAPEIARFFHGAGLPILEGYGLTETSPVIACNTLDACRIGTVGRPVAGVEVQIAEDGEILTRGAHVMRGYFNAPAATAEALSADGWFHTGDIGELADGYLRITDRKKDLIVTAGGKNIAPQPIEQRLTGNAFVAQAVLIGDRRKHPVVLVVPDWEQLERWAASQGVAWRGRAELLALPAIHAKMEREVRGELEGLASFEMPRKVAVLEHDFSIERGELTPTLKVKRRVVDQTYRALIDSLYADAG
jgi:long-chain acyl-CoA synthetase